MHGVLKKLKVTAHPCSDFKYQAQYSLRIGDAELSLEQLYHQEISLCFTGKIYCIACGRIIKKSYQQGYCYVCTKTLASCDLCIVKPELCHYQHGTCREPAWGLTNCFAPHVVYVANSSGLKVGVTRAVNIPGRWLDQGARQALPIFSVKSRYQAGLIEVCLARKFADKTNWRKLLCQQTELIDLYAARTQCYQYFATESQTLSDICINDIIHLSNEQSCQFEYYVASYPSKVVSLNLDKVNSYSGKLIGAKGQYLLFADNTVLNIRKYMGYEIRVVV